MDNLDDLFAQARDEGRDAPPALLARVLHDAETARARPEPLRKSRWRGMFAAMLGGAGALTGMATAAIAGVWIGIAQPEPVTALTDALWSGDQVDLIPTYDFLAEE